jgi:hypothetical protein
MVETSTKRSEFIGVVNPGKRIKNREWITLTLIKVNSYVHRKVIYITSITFLRRSKRHWAKQFCFTYSRSPSRHWFYIDFNLNPIRNATIPPGLEPEPNPFALSHETSWRHGWMSSTSNTWSTDSTVGLSSSVQNWYSFIPVWC